jgi:hypothetical protein
MELYNNIYDVIKIIRNIRDGILSLTDKYLLIDYPITPEQLDIVKKYRYDLRNYINNNYENFLIYKFYDLPTKPDFINISIVPTTLKDICPININNILFDIIL